MDGQGNNDPAGPDRRELVVVPHTPGPLISFDAAASGRGRDDLDELIDDLFPAVEERSGWFDAALLAVGVGLLAWSVLGTAPVIVTVLGVLALTLGCVLPIRGAWRRAQQHRERRRHEDLLEQGDLLDVSSPATASLVRAYGRLLDAAPRSGAELGDPAVSAAHAALLEVSSLLQGRAPVSERELGYVDQRAAAVADLVGALGEVPTSTAGRSPDDAATVHPDALLDAREELDRITPFNSVTRLQELTAEARTQRRGRS
jgi:hypothetical protein